MHNQPSSKKSILILIIIVAVSAVGYFFYLGTSTPDNGLLATEPNAAPISSEVISLLNQIRSLHIDATLFADPVYQTLRDYTVPIPEQNVGRTNPFAPVPGMPSGLSGTK